MFIDGEHTDWACFRDFIHGRKLLNENSIIAFHDSSLICKALKLIQEDLVASKRRFKFFKIRGSEISCILYDEFCDIDLDARFRVENSLDEYFDMSEEELFLSKLRHRVTPLLLAREFAIYMHPINLLYRAYRRLPAFIKPPIRSAYLFIDYALGAFARRP